MRRTYLLTGAGIVSFILFLIISIPANTIASQVKLFEPWNVQMAGVDGTAWNGRIRSLSFNGFQLFDTHWELNPAALLLGRLSAIISARSAVGEISFAGTVSVFGSIAIHDLKVAGPVAPIAGLLNLPVTAGRYQFHGSALNIISAWPTSFVGTGQVTDVPLNFMDDSSGPTGSYMIVFNTESVPADGRLVGTLSDQDGPVEVDGNIELTPPMNYALKIKLKAQPGAPTEITRALSFAGPPGPDGRHEISFAGSL